MTQPRTTISTDKILFTIFILLALLGCALASGTLFLSLAASGESLYVLAPSFLGLTMAGGGGAAMVVMRRRYQMAWPILLIAVALWVWGTLVFGLGVSSAFFYDEPAQFTSNFGYAVGLCIGPGVLLMAISQLLYGFEALRGKKRSEVATTAVAGKGSQADWITTLKAQEKSRLGNSDYEV